VKDTVPFVPGSRTSEAAAIAKRPTVGKDRLVVWRTIGEGRTCDEVEALTGMPHQNVSARITEMRDGGLVLRTDDTRVTRRGRQAFVYVQALGTTEDRVKAFRALRPLPNDSANWRRIAERLADCSVLLVDGNNGIVAHAARLYCVLCDASEPLPTRLEGPALTHEDTCPWRMAREALGRVR